MKGLLLSTAQRKELLKGDCVLGGKIALAYKTNKLLFLSMKLVKIT